MKRFRTCFSHLICCDKGEFVLKKRIELLRQIDKTGSILQAAKNVPSYKAAWDALDMMNNISPKPVIEKTAGGKRGGGSTLTEYGNNLIKIYDALEMAQAIFSHFRRKYQRRKLGEIGNTKIAS